MADDNGLWKSVGSQALKSRTDIATFLVGGGLGGLGDAIWNFAASESALTTGFLSATLTLGIKKFIEKEAVVKSARPRKVKDRD